MEVKSSPVRWTRSGFKLKTLTKPSSLHRRRPFQTNCCSRGFSSGRITTQNLCWNDDVSVMTESLTTSTTDSASAFCSLFVILKNDQGTTSCWFDADSNETVTNQPQPPKKHKASSIKRQLCHWAPSPSSCHSDLHSLKISFHLFWASHEK